MSSKASVYVLGGENTAALFDLDGVYVLDGGLSEKSPGFITCVREVTAVILSAPTLGNLGTTAALLEKVIDTLRFCMFYLSPLEKIIHTPENMFLLNKLINFRTRLSQFSPTQSRSKVPSREAVQKL